MQLKVGDVFTVVDDGRFHIDTQTDLMGNVMEVVGADQDKIFSVAEDLEVEDLKSRKRYILDNGELTSEEFEMYYALQPPEPTTGAVKSDGGSSSYYDLDLPRWLVEQIVERGITEGKFYVKTEELIEAVFDNDFSFGTLFKSLVRTQGARTGQGKQGNTVDYELNKIRYYSEKIREQWGR